MEVSQQSARRVVRFGMFEVDLRAGELFKQGIKIRLQQQPLRVLALLLEHPGEVVTREDLRQAIWPAGTFVESDVGLRCDSQAPQRPGRLGREPATGGDAAASRGPLHRDGSWRGR